MLPLLADGFSRGVPSPSRERRRAPVAVGCGELLAQYPLLELLALQRGHRAAALLELLALLPAHPVDRRAHGHDLAAPRLPLAHHFRVGVVMSFGRTRSLDCSSSRCLSSSAVRSRCSWARMARSWRTAGDDIAAAIAALPRLSRSSARSCHWRRRVRIDTSSASSALSCCRASINRT